MKILSFVSAAVLWIFFICGASLAVERYVALNGTNDGTGGYITWSGASTNIQDAVNKCSDYDVVWVTNGTYYCWSNSVAPGYTSMVTVARAQSITIQSMNGPAVTIVDANYPNFTNRCFYITSNATISGFTITNGHGGDVSDGGGVLINTSGRVTNCWITGNTTTNGMPTPVNENGGGGVRLKGGGEVVNCLIYANSSTNGGVGPGAGLFAQAAGTYVIRDCIISNNYNTGAAIYNVTSLSITNCTFINNNSYGLTLQAITGGTVENCWMIGNTSIGLSHATAAAITRNCQMINNAGGGVSISGGMLTNCLVSSNGGYGVSMSGNSGLANPTLVIDCTIVSNITCGVYFKGGILRNCLIACNKRYQSYGVGIGVRLYGGMTGRVENCTVVSNTMTGGATAGIASDNTGETGAGVFVNTICYSNFSGAAQANISYTYAHDLVFYNCCTYPTNDGSGNLLGSNFITNAPAFVNFAAGNFRLSRSSPCVNAGSNMTWMIGAFDLDRHRRLDRYSGIVDIGCYEYLPRGTMYGVR